MNKCERNVLIIRLEYPNVLTIVGFIFQILSLEATTMSNEILKKLSAAFSDFSFSTD
jgi:hypothetical protein